MPSPEAVTAMEVAALAIVGVVTVWLLLARALIDTGLHPVIAWLCTVIIPIWALIILAIRCGRYDKTASGQIRSAPWHASERAEESHVASTQGLPISS
jgi:small-conductance mechanosensitive channel